MSMTDPIADMLTRIRNANIAMHDEVSMPSSKLKVALANVLEKEGYIQGFKTVAKPSGFGENLTIDMKYSPERERVISGIKRISKPGLRIYLKKDEIPKILGGLGVAIISTSKGLVTDRHARKTGIGGEVLCHVW